MSGYLLDTHIWLWHLTSNPRLRPGLRAVLDHELTDCKLSPVSVWELGSLVSRGRFAIDTSLREFVDTAFAALPLREAPLTREVALRSHELDFPHRDPADRFLAATAVVYDLTLLTVDGQLISCEWLKTRSA